jgi:hypothetical protein
VNALIEQDAAAANLGIVPPPLLEAVAARLSVGAAQVEDAAERPAVGEGLRLGDARMMAVVEPENHFQMRVVPFRVADALDVGDGASGRLLAEHVTAVLERVDRRIRRDAVRCADECDVQPFRNQRLIARIHRHPEPRRVGDTRIDDADERQIGMIVDVAAADLPHVAVADDAGAKRPALAGIDAHAAPLVRANSSRCRGSSCIRRSMFATSSGRSTPTVR